MQPLDPGTRRYTQKIIYELAYSIRERDIITYEHCRRVAVYVNRLARNLGWSRRSARDLALAGLTHDLGKTWMQNELLHKDSPLSLNERSQMERHPGIAARILLTFGAPETLVLAVLHHHEAFNGNGYPDQLAGDAIPLGARLLSVADVYDALTSERPYKHAMDDAGARAYLRSKSGSSFDPAVVIAFLELLECRPDFRLTPRVCPLPLPPTPHPAWIRREVFDLWY
ncbi:MAG: HD-GYP domain-containing protein [Ktedonobacterales bacterium]